MSDITPDEVNSWGEYSNNSDTPPIEEADAPDDIINLDVSDDKKKEESDVQKNGEKGSETTATK